jgi:hypothetical protein
MPSLKELLEQEPPITSKVNLRGGDPEIIGADNEYSPSLDLSTDEAALKRARGGVIGQGTPRGYNNGNTYSSTPKS